MLTDMIRDWVDGTCSMCGAEEHVALVGRKERPICGACLHILDFGKTLADAYGKALMKEKWEVQYA